MSVLPLQVENLERGHKTILENQIKMHQENKEDREDDRRFFQGLFNKLSKRFEDLTEAFNDDRVANAKRSGAIGVITAIVSAFALKAAEHLLK